MDARGSSQAQRLPVFQRRLGHCCHTDLQICPRQPRHHLRPLLQLHQTNHTLIEGYSLCRTVETEHHLCPLRQSSQFFGRTVPPSRLIERPTVTIVEAEEIGGNLLEQIVRLFSRPDGDIIYLITVKRLIGSLPQGVHAVEIRRVAPSPRQHDRTAEIHHIGSP